MSAQFFCCNTPPYVRQRSRPQLPSNVRGEFTEEDAYERMKFLLDSSRRQEQIAFKPGETFLVSKNRVARTR